MQRNMTEPIISLSEAKTLTESGNVVLKTLAMQYVELATGFTMALKELNDQLGYLHAHNMIPKHWPVKEIVDAERLVK